MLPLSKFGQVRYISYNSIRTWYANLVKPKPKEPPYEHVVQIGDPLLRTVSEVVPPDLIKSKEIQFLIKRLKYTFDKYNCVGLSAPQIGLSFQIFIAEFSKKHAKSYSEKEFRNKEMTIQPQQVIINPEIKILDYSKVVFPESCESVKGYYAEVPRYQAIELKGRDENGAEISFKAHGWWARIIQHELDHLNGRLYTDIMKAKTLTCCCWDAVNERGGKVILSFNAD
nr:peptide deformylase, mitochondrial-like [Leptinotarsa decemlineata]